MVRVTIPGYASILIFRRKGDVETLISKQEYRVKRIPDPTPQIGRSSEINNRKNVITKEKLLEAKDLLPLMPNFDYDGDCTVVRYEITILPKEGDAVTFIAVGSSIPQYAREFMSTLKGDGDTIFFDNIMVKCPGDPAARDIGSIAYKLTPKE